MNLTTAEILTTLQEALAADTVLATWCATNCGGAPTIQIDFSREEVLSDSIYPLIAFVAMEPDGGITRGNCRLRLVVLICVLSAGSAAITEITNGVTGSRKRTYTGRVMVEGMRDQVEMALYRAATASKIGNVVIRDRDDGSRTDVPRFYALMDVEIKYIRTP